jgi:hypothetical protein
MADPAGTLRKLIGQGRSDEDVIRHFFLSALSRYPKPEEMAAARTFIAARPERTKGLEGLVWALLNSKEFSFNH